LAFNYSSGRQKKQRGKYQSLHYITPFCVPPCSLYQSTGMDVR